MKRIQKFLICSNPMTWLAGIFLFIHSLFQQLHTDMLERKVIDKQIELRQLQINKLQTNRR